MFVVSVLIIGYGGLFILLICFGFYCLISICVCGVVIVVGWV